MLSENQRNFFWKHIQINILIVVMLIITCLRINSPLVYVPIAITTLGSIYQIFDFVMVYIAPVSTKFLAPFD